LDGDDVLAALRCDHERARHLRPLHVAVAAEHIELPHHQVVRLAHQPRHFLGSAGLVLFAHPQYAAEILRTIKRVREENKAYTSLAVQALFSSRTLLIVRRISAAYWSPVDRTVRMVRDCNTQGVSSYTIHPTKEKPMPINEPHEDLPARRPNGNAPVPSDEQMIAAPIAAAWWEQFQAGPDFRRARAIPELPLRASAVSQRCDRQFWYSLTDIEPTDASDAASVFRMRLGSIVHDELDKSDVLKGHTA